MLRRSSLALWHLFPKNDMQFTQNRSQFPIKPFSLCRVRTCFDIIGVWWIWVQPFLRKTTYRAYFIPHAGRAGSGLTCTPLCIFMKASPAALDGDVRRSGFIFWLHSKTRRGIRIKCGNVFSADHMLAFRFCRFKTITDKKRKLEKKSPNTCSSRACREKLFLSVTWHVTKTSLAI